MDNTNTATPSNTSTAVSDVETVTSEVSGAAVDLGGIVLDAEKLDFPSMMTAIKSLHDRITRIEQHAHNINPRGFLAEWIGKIVGK